MRPKLCRLLCLPRTTSGRIRCARTTSRQFRCRRGDLHATTTEVDDADTSHATLVSSLLTSAVGYWSAYMTEPAH